MSNQPISNHDTPDPWLIPSPHHSRLFYLTFTLGNRIEIWSSDSLESFHDSSPSLRKSVVWHPPPGSPWSADIWAPELHFYFGTWWLYAAGAPPSAGNKGHRTIVLRCTDQNCDPMNEGAWVFEGPLRGLPGSQWAIDATVFSPDPGHGMQGGRPDEQRRWFVCYSGWPLGDQSDTQQDLFLARLKSPYEADEASLTCIGRAEMPWERPDEGRRGVNEGPTWVALRDGQWRGIVYSAHGSWTPEYKLGLLQFLGGPNDDLCNAALWKKRSTPLLVSDKGMGGPFGPGHASFVSNPSDGRVFCVYHGTEKEDEGWRNRKGRVLCMGADVFVEGARTMCCAYSVCGPVGDTHGVTPGAMAQGQGQGQGHDQRNQGQNQGQNYNQSWQGQQPQPQHQYPGQQQQQQQQQQSQQYSPNPQSQYPGQQQQHQQYPPPPQSPPQSHSAYPGQQQQFQPPPQQGYPAPTQQMTPGPPSQQVQNAYQPGQQNQSQNAQYQHAGGYTSSSASNANASGSSGSGSGGKNFEKYTNEIQKRIPAQYQGYFEKAKKFLK